MILFFVALCVGSSFLWVFVCFSPFLPFFLFFSFFFFFFFHFGGSILFSTLQGYFNPCYFSFFCVSFWFGGGVVAVVVVVVVVVVVLTSVLR